MCFYDQQKTNERRTEKIGKGERGCPIMDKTLRTIRSEIENGKEGIIPDVTLVIDTDILADHAWSRDSNVTYLIDEIVPEHPDFLGERIENNP